ncbi:MAG: DUF1015 domain-containing protein [Sphaerochaeta sp.]|jgi:hypothetical protein|nr:DUF1015 domain-containing protein [Spirochaetales bacterium]
MTQTGRQLAKYALKSCDILVPKSEINLKKWAVVACDQYTSEPEYWNRVAQAVGEAPSALHIIYPEVYLEEEDPQKRITTINETMDQYLKEDIFDHYQDSFFLIKRTTDHAPNGRWGLLAGLDLEAYNYNNGSKSLIRATEETIIDRIPPRKKIRKNASLEIPHILVLIDDPLKKLIEPLAATVDSLHQVYDTDLMEGGGHVAAWLVNSQEHRQQIADAIGTLHQRLDPSNPLLYAMGDGNHSLATAKSCWEDLKATLTEEERDDHPARFALVEIENIHDPALEFEPIHRVLFGLDRSAFEAALLQVCSSFDRIEVPSLASLERTINEEGAGQRFGYVDNQSFTCYTLQDPDASIAAGSLQHLIDSLLEGDACTVDYIHGNDVVQRLGSEVGNIGLLLPEVSKHTFFETIIKDNSLPRKTFSMGHAHEKRFYLEARKITP